MSTEHGDGSESHKEITSYANGMEGVAFGAYDAYRIVCIVRDPDGQVNGRSERTVFVFAGTPVAPDDMLSDLPEGSELINFEQITRDEAMQASLGDSEAGQDDS